MTRYYIVEPTTERGYMEIEEKEFKSLHGTAETRPYIERVYMGEMTLADVPAELRDSVSESVETRLAYYGPYAERELSAEEALAILTGGAAK